MGIVGLVYSQSDIMAAEVYLLQRIDSLADMKESMQHMKAIYFLRPTLDNIRTLCQTLKTPKFGEYHLCMCEFLLLLFLIRSL